MAKRQLNNRTIQVLAKEISDRLEAKRIPLRKEAKEKYIESLPNHIKILINKCRRTAISLDSDNKKIESLQREYNEKKSAFKNAVREISPLHFYINENSVENSFNNMIDKIAQEAITDDIKQVSNSEIEDKIILANLEGVEDIVNTVISKF